MATQTQVTDPRQLVTAPAPQTACPKCGARDCAWLLVQAHVRAELAPRLDNGLGKLLHLPAAALAATHSMQRLRELTARVSAARVAGDISLSALACALWRGGVTLRELFVLDLTAMPAGCVVGAGCVLGACPVCGLAAWNTRRRGKPRHVHVLAFDSSGPELALLTLGDCEGVGSM